MPTRPPLAVMETAVELVQRVLTAPAIAATTEKVQEAARGNGAIAAVPLAAVSLATPPLVTASSLLSLGSWWHLPGLVGSLVRRKRHPWGVVFDAATKEPLDPVLLTLTGAAGQRHQAVSDIYGHYEFLVEPGTYRLTAQKSHYAFPAPSLQGKTSDGVYDDLYFGSPITVGGEGSIALNLPMEGIALDWNQWEKRRLHLGGPVLGARLRQLLELLFYLAFAWSVLMIAVAPTRLNSLVLLLFAGTLAATTFGRRGRRWGSCAIASIARSTGRSSTWRVWLRTRSSGHRSSPEPTGATPSWSNAATTGCGWSCRLATARTGKRPAARSFMWPRALGMSTRTSC